MHISAYSAGRVSASVSRRMLSEAERGIRGVVGQEVPVVTAEVRETSETAFENGGRYWGTVHECFHTFGMNWPVTARILLAQNPNV